jgi:hypothetical protein
MLASDSSISSCFVLHFDAFLSCPYRQIQFSCSSCIETREPASFRPSLGSSNRLESAAIRLLYQEVKSESSPPARFLAFTVRSCFGSVSVCNSSSRPPLHIRALQLLNAHSPPLQQTASTNASPLCFHTETPRSQHRHALAPTYFEQELLTSTTALRRKGKARLQC